MTPFPKQKQYSVTIQHTLDKPITDAHIEKSIEKAIEKLLREIRKEIRIIHDFDCEANECYRFDILIGELDRPRGFIFLDPLTFKVVLK